MALILSDENKKTRDVAVMLVDVNKHQKTQFSDEDRSLKLPQRIEKKSFTYCKLIG